MSPSGVITREVNPVPAPVITPPVIPAPRISSFVPVVVAAPLLAVLPLPAAAAVTSSGLLVLAPLYSSARTSTKFAAWLNVTVTVLLPPAMFLA
jgi:hypothetical protein